LCVPAVNSVTVAVVAPVPSKVNVPIFVEVELSTMATVPVGIAPEMTEATPTLNVTGSP